MLPRQDFPHDLLFERRPCFSPLVFFHASSRRALHQGVFVVFPWRLGFLSRRHRLQDTSALFPAFSCARPEVGLTGEGGKSIPSAFGARIPSAFGAWVHARARTLSCDMHAPPATVSLVTCCQYLSCFIPCKGSAHLSLSLFILQYTGIVPCRPLRIRGHSTFLHYRQENPRQPTSH